MGKYHLKGPATRNVAILMHEERTAFVDTGPDARRSSHKVAPHSHPVGLAEFDFGYLHCPACQLSVGQRGLYQQK